MMLWITVEMLGRHYAPTGLRDARFVLLVIPFPWNSIIRCNVNSHNQTHSSCSSMTILFN